MFKRLLALLVAVASAVIMGVACAADVGVPTSPTGVPAAGSGSAGAEGSSALKATVPTPLSPSDGQRLETRRATLTASNAQGKFVSTAFTYRFQLFDEGQLVHDSGTVPQGSESTSYAVPGELQEDEEYTWWVRAELDGVAGPWSTTAWFLTPLPPPPPPPPVSAPSRGSACGPPFPGTPVEIVACQRAFYGTPMADHELVEFLFGVAADLNNAGIPDGPYGVLRKTSGHNCGGYSCDIICAGQGSSQRQYDVLLDGDGVAIPIWSGPFTGSDIRVDVCEVP